MKISAIIGGSLLLASSAALAQGSPTTKAAPVTATATDVKPGASLRDMDGAPVGTIVSSTDQAVVVDTGETKIGVPLTMFRKDDKGLLLQYHREAVQRRSGQGARAGTSPASPATTGAATTLRSQSCDRVS